MIKKKFTCRKNSSNEQNNSSNEKKICSNEQKNSSNEIIEKHKK